MFILFLSSFWRSDVRPMPFKLFFLNFISFKFSIAKEKISSALLRSKLQPEIKNIIQEKKRNSKSKRKLS